MHPSSKKQRSSGGGGSSISSRSSRSSSGSHVPKGSSSSSSPAPDVNTEVAVLRTEMAAMKQSQEQLLNDVATMHDLLQAAQEDNRRSGEVAERGLGARGLGGDAYMDMHDYDASCEEDEDATRSATLSAVRKLRGDVSFEVARLDAQLEKLYELDTHLSGVRNTVFNDSLKVKDLVETVQGLLKDVKALQQKA
jgi:hypothetical protein